MQGRRRVLANRTHVAVSDLKLSVCLHYNHWHCVGIVAFLVRLKILEAIIFIAFDMLGMFDNCRQLVLKDETCLRNDKLICLRRFVLSEVNYYVSILDLHDGAWSAHNGHRVPDREPSHHDVRMGGELDDSMRGCCANSFVDLLKDLLLLARERDRIHILLLQVCLREREIKDLTFRAEGKTAALSLGWDLKVIIHVGIVSVNGEVTLDERRDQLPVAGCKLAVKGRCALQSCSEASGRMNPCAPHDVGRRPAYHALVVGGEWPRHDFHVL